MTMEIKTCEQYVLAQLFDQQDENDMLNRELKYRDERIDELTGQIDAIEAAHGSAMQQAIRKAGRDALMSHCTGYACEVTDGETFEDWCLENVRKYYLPEGISVLAFIKEFEPELRAKYDKQAGAAALATYGYCGSSNIVRAVRTGCKAGGHYWKRADEEDK